MSWAKIWGLCSLKAIFLACVLTPASMTMLPVTPAFAQFQIIIPGFGYGYRGRRYGRHRGYSRSARHSRRGGGSRGGEAGEVSAPPSASAPSSGGGGSSGKGVKGASD